MRVQRLALDLSRRHRRARHQSAPGAARRRRGRSTPWRSRGDEGDGAAGAAPRGRRRRFPPGTFKDTVVAVTGGGTGLGKAIASGVRAARRRRWPSSAAALDHLEAGVAAVEAAGGQGVGVAVRRARSRVAVADGVRRGRGRARPARGADQQRRRELPRPGRGPLARTAGGRWWAIVLDGTFYCSREFARRHLAAGTPGSIVNIGASYAWTGGPGFAHSAAAKAAVKNLTETLAVEWAPYGIRVNGLVPGLVPARGRGRPDPRRPGPRCEAEAANVPALRVGLPRELGWAATFLASPYAAYITGATLVVDGANWQRRNLLQPPFRPIREQLGREPFSAVANQGLHASPPTVLPLASVVVALAAPGRAVPSGPGARVYPVDSLVASLDGPIRGRPGRATSATTTSRRGCTGRSAGCSRRYPERYAGPEMDPAHEAQVAVDGAVHMRPIRPTARPATSATPDYTPDWDHDGVVRGRRGDGPERGPATATPTPTTAWTPRTSGSHAWIAADPYLVHFRYADGRVRHGRRGDPAVPGSAWRTRSRS